MRTFKAMTKKTKNDQMVLTELNFNTYAKCIEWLDNNVAKYETPTCDALKKVARNNNNRISMKNLTKEERDGLREERAVLIKAGIDKSITDDYLIAYWAEDMSKIVFVDEAFLGTRFMMIAE